MKILITGICGFVGSSVARYLRREFPAWDLVGIDNLSRKGCEKNRRLIEKELEIEFFHGDLREVSDIETLPRCDFVIDAAANPAVMAGVDGKTSPRQLIEHNLVGTINLLEYCRVHGAGFILLSTSRTYSMTSLSSLEVSVEQCSTLRAPLGTPIARYVPNFTRITIPGLGKDGIDEGYSNRPPVSLYGTSKVASEQMAVEYGLAFDFPVWINRCGVIGGAGQFAHPAQGIFAFWIHAFRENRPLKYIGFDGLGHQVRDVFHPEDLASLVASQLREPRESSRPHLLNLGGGLENSASLRELTGWCEDRFPNSRTKVEETNHSPTTRPFDLPWVVMNPSLAGDTWDWKPTYRISDLCEEIALFAEENPGWLSQT